MHQSIQGQSYREDRESFEAAMKPGAWFSLSLGMLLSWLRSADFHGEPISELSLRAALGSDSTCIPTPVYDHCTKRFRGLPGSHQLCLTGMAPGMMCVVL